MKKEGVFVLLAILILLVSVSFVNAGWFDDFFNKITGRVTENETGEEDIPDEEEEEVETEPPEEEPEPYEEGCEEGDIKYYTCEDGTKVPECKCENEGWVCKISVKEDCPDVGYEPETCAGSIKVTFNKGSYQSGDLFKMIVETFDPQGNHLPNYAFSAKMYDNRWHSASLEKTDESGYFIYEGIADKPAGGVTKVKFRVYTDEIGPCKSVEDTTEVKVELGECGIGECAPEPECKDKIRKCGGDCPACPEDGDDEDKEIFYLCNGCELEDGNCYSFGYRKDGNYCSDENNAFVNQLADNEECENDFECGNNLCIGGNCVSSNVLNKFLEWFKKLFGEEDEKRPGPEICSDLLIEEDIGDYEYNQTLYGVSEETQAPLFSDDCEQIGKIKCCVAQYLENGKSGMALMCPYDDRGDVENLVKCSIRREGDILEEYNNGEKVIKANQGKVMVWTYENYAIAVGKMPEPGIPEEVADAYFDAYKNDLGEIDITNIPPPRPPSSIELCGEIEDNIERTDCYIDGAISKSSGFKICEEIDYNSEHRDKCYTIVAEHIGDASICENVVDDSSQGKCLFWVAGKTGNDKSCVGIVDIDLQTMCYVNLAEKTENANICKKIIEIRIRDKCYRDVAIATNDASICELIINDGPEQLNPKDECYAGTD